MAYQGYLIKIGNYIVPFKYIKFDSYSALLSTTDLDSYRDADGKLHRNALSHKPSKAEWETPAMLDNEQFADLMRNIRNQYISAVEKNATVTMYIPEIDDYVTQEMYLPDVTVSIYRHNKDTGKLQYNSIRFAFIGY